MEKDQSAWLPQPPPPRPARRDAAIDAALRRFDGLEEAAPDSGRPRRSWASSHRPQLAIAFSAMLLVVIGIPAALIGIRNQPAPPEKAPAALAVRDVGHEPAPRAAVEPPPTTPAPSVELRKYRGVDGRIAAESEPPAAPAPAVAVAPPVAATAPPAPAARMAVGAPPPPPPPPLPPERVADRAEAGAQEVVVTGTQIANPALEAPSAAKMMAAEPAYAPFLAQLQTAVRANDRAALISMMGFPLRVGSRTYPDAESVERDFDRIFSPRVRRAIGSQRADRLVMSGGQARIGNGELWLGQGHRIRIVAVNP